MWIGSFLRGAAGLVLFPLIITFVLLSEVSQSLLGLARRLMHGAGSLASPPTAAKTAPIAPRRPQPWLGLAFLAIVLLGVAGYAVFVRGRGSVEGLSGSDVVKLGEKLYKQECLTCHGPTGERLPISPLNSKEFLDTRGDATLISVVSEGKGVMPAFGEARGGPFTEQQTRSIVAYINAKAGRQSTSVLADAGGVVFTQSCTRCHGANGDRIPIAPLNAKGFLDAKTDAELITVVRSGKGAMPGQSKQAGGKLEEVDTQAVVAFLRHGVEERTALLASRGRALYLGNCLQCHGVGGDRVASTPLASASYLESLGDGDILISIAEGKGIMPAFGTGKGGTMGVPDIASLLTYLKTWSGLNATSSLAPAGLPGTGRDLFLRNCIACHGASGDKVPGIRLLSKEFLNRETDDVLLGTITRGNAKGMPAWGQAAGGALSSAQVQSILDFLKSSAVSEGVTSPAPGQAVASGGAGSSAPAEVVVSVTQATVARGKEIFTSPDKCIQCHGETRDKIPTCKLTDGAWLKAKTDATLVQSITFGKGPMPSWGQAKGGPLSPDDVKAVVAYLKNAAGIAEIQAAPATGTTPSGSTGTGSSTAEAVAKGKATFMGTCAMCHGETRDKVPTCKLTDPEWLKSRGYEEVVLHVTNGKLPMMPAWGKAKGGPLSDEEIRNVVSFLWDAAGISQSGGSAATTAPAASGPVITAADVAKGKDIFMSPGKCNMCHGETRDKVPTCKLADGEWLKAKGFDGVVLDATNGKPPMMPAWGKAKGGPLSDDEIKAVVSYLWDAAGLNTGGGGAPAPAASGPVITAADVAKGKDIFMSPGKCNMCHGETRDKVPTCKLADGEWLKAKGFDGVVLDATNGKPPMMPAWGKAKGGPLSDDEIKAVVSYLWDAAGLNTGGGGVPAPAASGPVITAAAVAKGKDIFMSPGKCNMCHGETRDKVPTCKLADGEWLKAKGFDGVVLDATNGKPPMMPAWGKAKGGPLSDDEIKAVVSYLWDAAGLNTGGGSASAGVIKPVVPAGPTPTPEPFVVSAAEGKKIYMSTCVFCHMENGLGKQPCPLGSREWLTMMSDEGLMSRIRNGKPRAGMPTWGKALGGPFSDDQIKAVTLFLWENAK